MSKTRPFPFIDTLLIVGVGLIGGSFALDLKEKGRVKHVIGIGRSQANLETALKLGIVDEIQTDLAAVAARADLIFLATPVGQMGALMQQLAPLIQSETIITDGGSTKQDVVDLYTRYLPNHLAHCVPAHPIAGAENSGAQAARKGLYQHKNVVLCPLKETANEVQQTVEALWTACGAHVHTLTPHHHDELFSAVSHFPHLLAFAYVHHVLNHEDAARCFEFAGTGFKDFTRIAGSHPDMWRDILLSNRAAVLADLAGYQQILEQLKTALETENGDTLTHLFSEARTARTNWFKTFSG